MRPGVVSLLVGSVLLLTAGPVLAADLEEVAAGIADDGVFVESGASTSDAEIGALVAAARADGENLSIVVLAEEPVSGAVAFGDALVNRGVGGVIVVISPDSVGYAGAGDIYTVDDLDRALQFAIDNGGDDGAFATALVDSLTGVAESESGGAGGFLVPVVIALVLIGGLVWWRSRSASRGAAATEEKLATVRNEVQRRIDDVANDLLDMEEEVRQADNARADRFYNEAGETYREVSDALPGATTPADLIDLSNRLDNAIWQLDTAEAILDGTELPARPEPRTLTPEPTPERTRPIDTSQLPTPPSYQRRPARRSSYGPGSSTMDLLLQLGTAYAAGRMSPRRGPRRGIGGFLDEGTVRSGRARSTRSSPSRGTGGRVRGGRSRRGS